jgi:threonine/homoserine/homoserine lactone efflux protein
MNGVEPSLLVGFVMACVVLNLVPGPGMVFITAHGVAGGRRAGVVAATGMASGTVVHTIAAALGLSAVLGAAPFALDAVRIVGGVVLLFLAVSMWRRRGPVLPRMPRRSLRRIYSSAVLTNLANPKVVLFYLAFVPQFLTPGGWPTGVQIMVLGATLVVIGFVLDCAIGLASGTFSALLSSRPSFQRCLTRISAAIFGGLAVRLLVDRH